MKLGVVGTMVWDTIHGRDTRAEPFDEWGGIAYALAALEAALSPGWEIVPLVKVGRDLAPRANAFLHGLTRRAAAARFIEAPEPTNRVTLRYAASGRRAERLHGGVPPWHWQQLAPLVADCDALYVNFISGFEVSLTTAEQLRAGFAGPMYGDLHSLLLALHDGGRRTLTPLPDADRWFACFDAFQVNEDELGQLGPDPLAIAARALAAGVGLLVVTLGPRGAVYFTQAGWRFARGVGGGGPITTRRIAVRDARDDGDPTGCGDVFGATLVARLLAGDAVETAIGAANAAAARNVGHRGATDLHHHLRGAIARA